jgi:hypothetical protein
MLLASILLRGAAVVATTAPSPVVYQPGPGAAKDIWTTSTYSYAPSHGGPGGGLNNDWLRVGGWADVYYTLAQYDLSGLPSRAASAELWLYSIPDGGSAGLTQTPMYLDRITAPWDWVNAGTGADHDRLWWADRPTAQQWQAAPLPAPVDNSWYRIDITDLYNAWQDGTYPNYGLQLRPLYNDNNFDRFWSSDYADDPALRPKLVITSAVPEPAAIAFLAPATLLLMRRRRT